MMASFDITVERRSKDSSYMSHLGVWQWTLASGSRAGVTCEGAYWRLRACMLRCASAFQAAALQCTAVLAGFWVAASLIGRQQCSLMPHDFPAIVMHREIIGRIVLRSQADSRMQSP